jgi:hypothetical protein
VLALVRHRCPCGTSYVVSLAGEAELLDHPAWEADAAASARAIDESFVDGRTPGFFCPHCSRLHVRVAVPLVETACGEPGREDPRLSISLN